MKDPDYAIMSKRIDRLRDAQEGAAPDGSPAEADQSSAPDRPAKIARLDSSASSPDWYATGNE